MTKITEALIKRTYDPEVLEELLKTLISKMKVITYRARNSENRFHNKAYLSMHYRANMILEKLQNIDPEPKPGMCRYCELYISDFLA
jgi:23S rRNA maturation mini-RNase III